MQLPRLLTILTAAAVLGLTGCSEPKISSRDLRYVDVTEATSVVQGRKTMFGLGQKTAAWLDARDRASYEAGHIPGAIHLPLNEVKADDRRLRGVDVLVVYGNEYNSPIAEAMSKRLMALGFKDVRTLRGGLEAWRDAGNAIETGPPPSAGDGT